MLRDNDLETGAPIICNCSINNPSMDDIQNIVIKRDFIRQYSVRDHHFDVKWFFRCFYLVNIYFGTASIDRFGMNSTIRI